MVGIAITSHGDGGEASLSDQILMELVGDRVRIQLMPEVEAWTKARNITLPSALAIAALMMRSGALHDTLTVEGDPEMVVQVMGGSDRCAWLGISAWGYKGDGVKPERNVEPLNFEVFHPKARSYK